MQPVLLTGATPLVGGEWRPGCGVLLEGSTIVAVQPDDAPARAGRIVLPPGSLLAPGLIDIQVNGGGGRLFNDAPTAETALAIAASHRNLGTTSILPTLITDTEAAMRQAADASIALAGTGSPVLGIHFEGPFLGLGRPGVHDPRLIRSPSDSELSLLLALARHGDMKVLLTVAAEAVDDDTLRRLAAAGIILSAGHTDAGLERMQLAIAAGITGFTHLFNAMPPIAARAPGAAVAALLDTATWCGVIMDGIHVHPAMLRLLLACKPADRIMLVSDAMPPTGSDTAAFTLQGRQILRGHGRLVTEDGTLAGADICLADAVRHAVGLGVASAQALAMATAHPAAFLGLDQRIGRIAPGCRADLLLLTPELDVLGTWLAGAWSGRPGVLRAAA